MLGFAVQNSVFQATLGLVIVHPVYLFKHFVPYRKHNIRWEDHPFNTVQGVVAVHCGKNRERLQLLCGYKAEALVMAARTGLLVKISNQCTILGSIYFTYLSSLCGWYSCSLYGRFLLHIPFLIFLWFPPTPLSLCRKIPAYVECPLACPISVVTN